MAWSLAVLSEGDETLFNQESILFVDVEPQQAEASTGAATYAFQKL